jgi:hypothetical protein
MPDTIRDRAFRRDHEETEEKPFLQPLRPQQPQQPQPQAEAEPSLRQRTGFQATMEATAAPRPPEAGPTSFQATMDATALPEDRPTVAAEVAAGRRHMETGEFRKGLDNSMNMLRASAPAVAALVAGTVGAEETSQRLAERSQRILEEGPQHQPRVPEIRDVRSLTDGADYLAHLAGSQLPILGSIIGSALLTRGAAARTPVMRDLQRRRAKLMQEATRKGASEPARRASLEASQAIARRMDVQGGAAQAVGSIGAIIGVTAPEQAEILTDDEARGGHQARAAGALASTVGAGVIGVLPVHRFLRSAGLGQRAQRDALRANRQAVRDGIEKITGAAAPQRGLAQHVAREVPIQMGLQGIVEVGQEMSLRAAHVAFRENMGMFDDEAVGRYIEAAAASMIIGGFLGSLGPTIQAATLKMADQAENVGSLSEDVLRRIDEHAKAKMRANIFRNPTKTAAFREARELDDELQAHEGRATPEVRDRLARLVGEDFVDDVLAAHENTGTPLDTILRERLQKGGDGVKILESRTLGEDLTPDQRFELASTHNIGQTIAESFGGPRLQRTLEGMDEGRRFDTEMFIGELASDLAYAEDATADLVTQRRNQLSELLRDDEAVEAALETALRLDLRNRETLVRLEDGDPHTMAEGELRGEGPRTPTQMLSDEHLSQEQIAERERFETEGMQARDEDLQFLRTRYAGDGSAASLQTKPQAIRDHPVLGDLVPFVRPRERGKTTAAQKEAARLTQQLGLQHEVRSLGRDLREQGLPINELVPIANQILERATAQERVPLWAKTAQGNKKRAFRSSRAAEKFLDNFEVAVLSDQVQERPGRATLRVPQEEVRDEQGNIVRPAQEVEPGMGPQEGMTPAQFDRANVEAGGFSVNQLRSFILGEQERQGRKIDASGLPREDQVMMISPAGERVAVDLVTANREMRRMRRYSPREVDPLQSAQEALGQLYDMGFRFPTEQETRQALREAQNRLRGATKRPHRQAIEQQIRNFRERGEEGLTEGVIVDRRRAKRAMKLQDAVNETWQHRHGVLASLADQQVDETFVAQLADRMDTVGRRLAARDDGRDSSAETVGAQIISQALHMVADGDVAGANAVLRNLSNEERIAGERLYDQERQALADTVDEAAVRVGDVMFGSRVGRQRRELRAARVRGAVKAAQERARKAPLDATLTQVTNTLKSPRLSTRRKKALREAKELLKKLRDGDRQGAINRMAELEQSEQVFQRRLAHQIKQELFLAKTRVQSEATQQQLMQRLPSSLEKALRDQQRTLDLLKKVTERSLERPVKTRASLRYAADSKFKQELSKLLSSMESIFERAPKMQEFLEANSEVGRDGVLLMNSPGVQPNLTLHDYILYASQQEGQTSQEFLQANEVLITASEASQMVNRIAAHEQMILQFNRLKALGMEDAMLESVAKRINFSLKRGEALVEKKLVDRVVKDLKLKGGDAPTVRPVIRAFVAAGITARQTLPSPADAPAQTMYRVLRKLKNEYDFFLENDAVQEVYAKYVALRIAMEDAVPLRTRSGVFNPDFHREVDFNDFLRELNGLQEYQSLHSIQKDAVKALLTKDDAALNQLRERTLEEVGRAWNRELFFTDGETQASMAQEFAMTVAEANDLPTLISTLSALKSNMSIRQEIQSRITAKQEFDAGRAAHPIEDSTLYTASMPAKQKNAIQSMVNTLTRPLGIKVRLFTSAKEIETALGSERHNLDGMGIEEAIRMATVPGNNGFMLSMPGDPMATIAEVNGEAFMYVSGRLSPTKAVMTALHEMGHIFEYQLFSRESESVQRQIFEAYEEHLRQTLGDEAAARAVTVREAVIKKRGAADLLFGGGALSTQPGRHTTSIGDIISALEDPAFADRGHAVRELEYHLGFREWWADQVSQWAVKQEQPRNVIERFFKRVAEAFKRILDTVMQQNGRFPEHRVVHDYLNKRFFDTPQSAIDTIRSREPTIHWAAYTHKAKFLDLMAKAFNSKEIKKLAEDFSPFANPTMIAHSMDYTLGPYGEDANFAIRDVINNQMTAEEVNIMAKAFNRPRVREQIVSFVKDDVAWLAEIESNQDALIATGIQLWEAGMLKVPPRAAGLLGKIDDFMINKVFGELTQTEQAAEIMQAMVDGRIARRKTFWPQAVGTDANIGKGYYGLSRPELLAVRQVAASVGSNATIQDTAHRLMQMRQFRAEGVERARMIAQDINNGVFTEDVIADALRAPEWAVNPERQFVVEKAVFDNNVTSIARGVRHAAHFMGHRMGLIFGQMMKARRSDIQAVQDAFNVLYRDVASGRFSPSFDQAKTMNIAKYMNTYTGIIQNLTDAEKNALRDGIMEGRFMAVKDGDPKNAVLAQKKYIKMMEDIRNHLKEAGLEVGNLGVGKNRVFTPWVFDERVFREKGREFYKFATQKKYMKHWLKLAKSKDNTIDWLTDDGAPLNNFIRSYIRILGNQEGFADSDVIVDPGRQTQPHLRSMFKRELDFLWRAGDEGDRKTLSGFLDQNLNRVVATYINQSMKRATYNEFLGEGRQEELEAQIRAGGGGDEAVQMFRDAIDMQMGTYGLELAPSLQRTLERVGSWMGRDWSDLDPAAYRRIQGYVVTYQNIRTLAFAAMTNVVDAAGLLVRSGSLSMALGGMRDGFSAMRAAAKNKTERAALAEQAEMLGVAEKVVTQDALGQLYGGVHYTGMAAQINDTFFHMNGMMALNRFLRMSALGTAQIYMKKHAALAKQGKKESAKILHDLGLDANDIVLDDQGNIALLSDDRIRELSHGLRPMEIQRRVLPREKVERVEGEARQRQEDFQEVLRDQRVRDSMFRFVDEAVMRPSAMQRPNWGNDPNWGMFFHLKAFMYTYHERHLRRALNKLAAEGDAGPLMLMGSFVGMMIAVDMMRDFVQHGPDGDPRKEEWGFGDYVLDGAHRSGVYGAANYIPDMHKTVQLREHQDLVTKAMSPLIELGGPAVSQADQLIRAGFGQRRRRAGIDALPANNVWRAFQNWGDSMEHMPGEEVYESVTGLRWN